MGAVRRGRRTRLRADSRASVPDDHEDSGLRQRLPRHPTGESRRSTAPRRWRERRDDVRRKACAMQPPSRRGRSPAPASSRVHRRHRHWDTKMMKGRLPVTARKLRSSPLCPTRLTSRSRRSTTRTTDPSFRSRSCRRREGPDRRESFEYTPTFGTDIAVTATWRHRLSRPRRSPPRCHRSGNAASSGDSRRSLNTSASFVADRGTGRPTPIRSIDSRSKHAVPGKMRSIRNGCRRRQTRPPGVAPTVVTLPVFPTSTPSSLCPSPSAAARRRTAPGKTGVIDHRSPGGRHRPLHALLRRRPRAHRSGGDPPLLVHLLFGTGTSSPGTAFRRAGRASDPFSSSIFQASSRHNITFRIPPMPPSGAFSREQPSAPASPRPSSNAKSTFATQLDQIHAFKSAPVEHRLSRRAGIHRGLAVSALGPDARRHLRLPVHDVEVRADRVVAANRRPASLPRRRFWRRRLPRPERPDLDTLVLGGNRARNYVDLMGNPAYHAMTSAG